MKIDPVPGVVLGDTRQPESFRCENNTSLMRTDIAIGKDWDAVGMGFSSQRLGQVAVDLPQFVRPLTTIANGRFVPVPVGVLVRDNTKMITGTVGISGSTSDIGEVCQVASTQASELTADTGA